MIGVDSLRSQPADQDLQVAPGRLRVQAIQGPNGEADYFGILNQQVVGLGLPRPAAGEADDQNSPERRDATHRLIKYIATYGVEDYVCAAPIGQRLHIFPE